MLEDLVTHRSLVVALRNILGSYRGTSVTSPEDFCPFCKLGKGLRCRAASNQTRAWFPLSNLLRALQQTCLALYVCIMFK